jgi:hypothetical protein
MMQGNFYLPTITYKSTKLQITKRYQYVCIDGIFSSVPMFSVQSKRFSIRYLRDRYIWLYFLIYHPAEYPGRILSRYP